MLCTVLNLLKLAKCGGCNPKLPQNSYPCGQAHRSRHTLFALTARRNVVGWTGCSGDDFACPPGKGFVISDNGEEYLMLASGWTQAAAALGAPKH